MEPVSAAGDEFNTTQMNSDLVLF